MSHALVVPKWLEGKAAFCPWAVHHRRRLAEGLGWGSNQGVQSHGCLGQTRSLASSHPSCLSHWGVNTQYSDCVCVLGRDPPVTSQLGKLPSPQASSFPSWKVGTEGRLPQFPFLFPNPISPPPHLLSPAVSLPMAKKRLGVSLHSARMDSFSKAFIS